MPMPMEKQAYFGCMVEDWVSKHYDKENPKGDKLLAYTLNKVGVTLEEEKDPQQWILTHSEFDNNSINQVESSFKFCGMVWDHTLSPAKLEKSLQNGVKRVTQSVVITGMGSKSFQRGLDTLNKIHDYVIRQFPEDAVRSWHPMDLAGYEFPAIKLSNQMFVHRSKVGRSKVLEIPSDMDPNNILGTASLESGYCYTEDCKVDYRALEQSEKGKVYKPVKPVTFHRGDIVEIIFSIHLYPLRSQDTKHIPGTKVEKWSTPSESNTNQVMITKLLGVTLLDGAISKEFTAAFEKKSTSRGVIRKRIDYEEGNIE
ncbi:hypothetical protein BT96DRAFT_999518 [Gymnopus androsaceus JB14]|uniref:Uncharacterized protein n=1 Tax=Gymnopus androsaceus JB14 TaxID=1447944 RepID=A0A6A4H6B8_9AGAR|nr:hypothetical protein BT96DRAFT_999518 [Gymnopus androsaceus JB14]